MNCTLPVKKKNPKTKPKKTQHTHKNPTQLIMCSSNDSLETQITQDNLDNPGELCERL